MILKKSYEVAKRLVNRCETNPRYLGLDLIYQVMLQIRFKLGRKNQLLKNIPDIYDYNSVLYVGARTNRIDFGKEFLKKKYKIDILEVFEPNVLHLKKIEWIDNVFQEDVRKVDNSVRKKYDIVFWWHGPEHIEKKDLSTTLAKLEQLSNHLVVCGCPWGEFEQGALYNNPNERHLSALLPEDFQKLNYQTSTIGFCDVPMSNILSWKRI